MFCLMISVREFPEPPLNVIDLSGKPKWSYSIFTNQFGRNMYSMPPPMVQPVRVSSAVKALNSVFYNTDPTIVMIEQTNWMRSRMSDTS